MPEILRGDLLERGYAVRQVTGQLAQVAGFATGGALLALLSPHAALVMNSVTFVLSAAVLACGSRLVPRLPLPSVRSVPGRATSLPERARSSRTPRVARWPSWSGWPGPTSPRRVAAPYAAQLGARPVAVGLLLAAIPAGSVVGAIVFTRWVPSGPENSGCSRSPWPPAFR